VISQDEPSSWLNTILKNKVIADSLYKPDKKPKGSLSGTDTIKTVRELKNKEHGWFCNNMCRQTGDKTSCNFYLFKLPHVAVCVNCLAEGAELKKTFGSQFGKLNNKKKGMVCHSDNRLTHALTHVTLGKSISYQAANVNEKGMHGAIAKEKRQTELEEHMNKGKDEKPLSEGSLIEMIRESLYFVLQNRLPFNVMSKGRPFVQSLTQNSSRQSGVFGERALRSELVSAFLEFADYVRNLLRENFEGYHRRGFLVVMHDGWARVNAGSFEGVVISFCHYETGRMFHIPVLLSCDAESGEGHSI
jgi:hypothetical protein